MRVEEESSCDDSDSCPSEDGIDLKDIEEIFRSSSKSRQQIAIQKSITEETKSAEILPETDKSPASNNEAPVSYFYPHVMSAAPPLNPRKTLSSDTNRQLSQLTATKNKVI